MQFSYISIGCAIFSTDSFSTLTYNSHPYLEISICGCSLVCPAVNGRTIAGTVNIVINSAAVSSQGLNDLKLYLPDNHVQYVDVPDMTTTTPPGIPCLGFSANDNPALFIDEIAVVVMKYRDATSQALRHCPSFVFTQTPAQLNGVLYQCCT